MHMWKFWVNPILSNLQEVHKHWSLATLRVLSKSTEIEPVGSLKWGLLTTTFKICDIANWRPAANISLFIVNANGLIKNLA